MASYVSLSKAPAGGYSELLANVVKHYLPLIQCDFMVSIIPENNTSYHVPNLHLFVTDVTIPSVGVTFEPTGSYPGAYEAKIPQSGKLSFTYWDLSTRLYSVYLERLYRNQFVDDSQESPGTGNTSNSDVGLLREDYKINTLTVTVGSKVYEFLNGAVSSPRESSVNSDSTGLLQCVCDFTYTDYTSFYLDRDKNSIYLTDALKQLNQYISDFQVKDKKESLKRQKEDISDDKEAQKPNAKKDVKLITDQIDKSFDFDTSSIDEFL